MAITFLAAPIEIAADRPLVAVRHMLGRHGMRTDLLACLWHTQAGRCFYCDQDIYLDVKPHDPHAATRDHIFPKAVRKKAKPSRLRDACVAACRRCNQERGALRWHEYIAIHENRKASGTHGGHYVGAG